MVSSLLIRSSKLTSTAILFPAKRVFLFWSSKLKLLGKSFDSYSTHLASLSSLSLCLLQTMVGWFLLRLFTERLGRANSFIDRGALLRRQKSSCPTGWWTAIDFFQSLHFHLRFIIHWTKKAPCNTSCANFYHQQCTIVHCKRRIFFYELILIFVSFISWSSAALGHIMAWVFYFSKEGIQGFNKLFWDHVQFCFCVIRGSMGLCFSKHPILSIWTLRLCPSSRQVDP